MSSRSRTSRCRNISSTVSRCLTGGPSPSPNGVTRPRPGLGDSRDPGRADRLVEGPSPTNSTPVRDSPPDDRPRGLRGVDAAARSSGRRLRPRHQLRGRRARPRAVRRDRRLRRRPTRARVGRAACRIDVIRCMADVSPAPYEADGLDWLAGQDRGQRDRVQRRPRRRSCQSGLADRIRDEALERLAASRLDWLGDDYDLSEADEAQMRIHYEPMRAHMMYGLAPGVNS